MSRLDKFEDILENYNGRHSPDTAPDRLLIVLDGRCQEMVWCDMEESAILALKASFDYVQEQAIVEYGNKKARFSGWHDFSDIHECENILSAMDRPLPAKDCMKEALQEKTNVITVTQGATNKALEEMLNQHYDAGNRVVMIEMSGIWPAKYTELGFGERIPQKIMLKDLMPAYVRHIYAGEPEP